MPVATLRKGRWAHVPGWLFIALRFARPPPQEAVQAEHRRDRVLEYARTLALTAVVVAAHQGL
jgi:hypothetical protein